MRTLAALNTQAHSVQPQLDFSLIQTNSRFMASNYHYRVVQSQRPDSNNSTQEHAVLPERIALTSCKCFVIGCFQAFGGLAQLDEGRRLTVRLFSIAQTWRSHRS